MKLSSKKLLICSVVKVFLKGLSMKIVSKKTDFISTHLLIESEWPLDTFIIREV